MAEAIYFHATLHRFEPLAFNEVILRFNTAIQDVSARCWYDTEQEWFCLTCPSPIGQQANAALKMVLSEYIDGEWFAADRDDRPPRLTIFAEMVYNDEPVDDADLGHVAMLNESEPSLGLPHSSNAAKIILHSVNIEVSSNSVISMFRLNQLPDGLVDRILPANDSVSTAFIRYGATARAVFWDTTNEVHVFNGRVGSPIFMTTSPEAHILRAARFTALADQRLSRGVTVDDGGTKSPIMWKFKDGDVPDVQRYLAGMGEIELVDPNIQSDAPADAKRFLDHAIQPPGPQGRPRVPKAKAIPESDDESDNSDDESETSASMSSGEQLGDNSITAANVNKIFGVTASSEQTVSNKMGSSSSKTVVGRREEAPPVSNSALFPANSATALLSRPSQEINSYTPSIAASATGGAFNRNSMNRSSSGPDSASSYGTGIPTHDRNYASVDRIGLNGHTQNTALWARENAAPKKKTANKSGIARRQVSITTDPTSLLHTNRTGSSPASINSYVPPSAYVQYSDIQSSPQKWAGVMTQPQLSAGKLIDVADCDQASQTTGMPPGLEQFGRKRTQPDQDRIVERLQIAPDESNGKRYMMTQKAPKKAKKPHKKPATVNAELPKPEPIPPPQSKKGKKESVKSDKAAKNPNLMQTSNQSSGAKPETSKESDDLPLPPLTAIEELLHSTISSNTKEAIEGVFINASFGMILVRQPESKDSLKGAVHKEKLQAKLRAAGDSLQTSFFPRLTTSIADALFLLDLIPGSRATATMNYEVVVKNAEGKVRTITFSQSDRSGVQVVCPDSSLGTTYVHYPLRIWDAKITVQRSQLVPSMTDFATECVSSIRTIDDAPSFVAKLPRSSFTIESVFAKRKFSKMVADGVELRVVEAQELQLMSIESEHYNIQATAHSATQMVNEQRLWWECELRSKIVDSASAATLQALVDEMVTQMDGVGYGNTGPWTKEQIVINAASVAASEVPFW